MNQHMKWVCAAALLLSPLAASAQSAPPGVAQGAAPPAVAPAAPVADDDGSWLAELFEGAPGEAPPALGDAEGHEAGLMAFDDDGDGPDGPRRMHRMAPGAHGHGMMMRRNLGMRFAALDLTDAQRDKLRDIHEAAARKSVQRRADMQLARMDLRKLMRAESPSAASVNAQIDKISRLQAEGMKAHFDTFMQARAVLTPEQQKKLRSGPAPMRMEHDRHGED